MTLRDKIYKAIDQMANNSNSVATEQYESNYDGFTHSSYSGLSDQVEDELFSEGYEDNAPMSVVEDFVFELF
tara:strand:- start:278 stop:493 length:216 start_codon:yes stop_codon:yes gene_type:complete